MEDNKFKFVKLEENLSEHIAAPHYSYWKSVFRKFFSSKVAILMLCISLFVVAMSIFQPMISGFDPNVTISEHINEPWRKYLGISLQFPFGTDGYGVNIFDYVWLGTRTSLEISIIATTVTTILGVIVGGFWGYSKKMDAFMIELYNMIANVPFTLIVMVLVYVLGSGKWPLIFALSCTSWLGVAYMIRVQVMIIRDREYNLASRCLGTPTYKILLHNVLPYLISVIVTSVSRDIPSYISYEVFLSYIGVGLGEGEASLGRMIQDYSQYMESNPHIFWIPVFISALISVSLYIVGQTLADASDPRTHMM